MDRKNLADNIFFECDDKVDISNKWPALVVAGKKVTEKQAAEILIRTDYNAPDFTYAGNDKHHARRLNALFGITDISNAGMTTEQRRELWEAQDNLAARLGKVSLGYLYNSQIVSSFIGGPHGWCNWDGDIFCNTYNVGKWPSLDEIAEDWGAIAQAFPFLDLRSQLFDKEACEDNPQPIVEFVVSEGVVVVTNPRHQIAPPVSLPLNAAILFGSTVREHGIGVHELGDKLKMVYGEIPQL